MIKKNTLVRLAMALSPVLSDRHSESVRLDHVLARRRGTCAARSGGRSPAVRNRYSCDYTKVWFDLCRLHNTVRGHRCSEVAGSPISAGACRYTSLSEDVSAILWLKGILDINNKMQ